MIESAAGKGARGVANGAILGGGYVWDGFAERDGTVVARVAALADDCRAGVINKVIGECCGVVAHRAIGRSHRMARRRGCTHCVGAVMAGVAPLRHGVDDGVIENTAEVEGIGVMADAAIDGRNGMIRRRIFTRCVGAIVAVSA